MKELKYPNLHRVNDKVEMFVVGNPTMQAKFAAAKAAQLGNAGNDLEIKA